MVYTRPFAFHLQNILSRLSVISAWNSAIDASFYTQQLWRIFDGVCGDCFIRVSRSCIVFFFFFVFFLGGGGGGGEVLEVLRKSVCFIRVLQTIVK